VFQQASKHIIPTPPSKDLLLNTLKIINTYYRYCFRKERRLAYLLSLSTLNTVEIHTVDKGGISSTSYQKWILKNGSLSALSRFIFYLQKLIQKAVQVRLHFQLHFWVLQQETEPVRFALSIFVYIIR
jgi:hypothetical protein